MIANPCFHYECPVGRAFCDAWMLEIVLVGRLQPQPRHIYGICRSLENMSFQLRSYPRAFAAIDY